MEEKKVSENGWLKAALEDAVRVRASAIQTSETVKELAAAMLEAQKSIGVVGRDGKATVQTKSGGSYGYTYATLTDTIAACKAAYNAQNIVIVQGASAVGRNVTVTTRFLHTSGEWLENSLTMEVPDSSPQAVGSAVTYGRRYTVTAGAFLATDDDDGAAAQPAKQEPAKPETKKEAEARRKRALVAIHAEWSKFEQEAGLSGDIAAAVYKAFIAHESQGSSLSSADLPTEAIEAAIGKLRIKRAEIMAWATSDGWKKELSDYGFADHIPEPDGGAE